MSRLTGDKNVNFLILMQLNDKELSAVCSVNKYVNELCKDETFWFNRSLLTFKLSSDVLKEMKTYLEFDSWKEFYTWLKNLSVDIDIYPKPLDFRNSGLFYQIISGSLEKKQVINKIMEIFKEVEFDKWINKSEFLKVIKRSAFVNAQDIINVDYKHEDDEDEIDEIEWKTYKSINEEEMLKPFLYRWRKAREKYDI